MNERTIFLNALEEEDPERRRAYLDSACAGKPGLRERIEALLRSHKQVDTFLEVPAMEQIVQNDARLAFLGPPKEPGSLGRLDQYEVLEIVGWGSMGMVLKGRDTKLQRIVAIKVLKPLLAGSDTARKLFVREAQAAAAVRDDNVIAIYALSEEGLVPYLVMEYIAGTTLGDLIKRNGALGLRETLRIGMQVAQGLAAAHAQGLTHRDIKPGNILLENHVQRVKITDFGLAHAEESVITGTPMFMSPEQARGDPFDQRSDLFSLGSILYILCTGRQPFPAGNTAAVLKRVRGDRARPIREINPDIPEWLCALIGKLHAKEAKDRFGSAQEIADILGRQLELLQRPSPAPKNGSEEAEGQPAEREAQSAETHTAGLRAPRSAVYLLIVACLAGLLLALAMLTFLMLRLPRRLENQRNFNGQPGEFQPEAKFGPIIPLELQRDRIPPRLLTLAGGGDPARAPAELAAVLGDGPFLLPRLGGTVCALAFSPDGKRLASGSLDGTIAIWGVDSGTVVRVLLKHSRSLMQIQCSPDGKTLAAGNETGTGTFWTRPAARRAGHCRDTPARCAALPSAGTASCWRQVARIEASWCTTWLRAEPRSSKPPVVSTAWPFPQMNRT